MMNAKNADETSPAAPAAGDDASQPHAAEEPAIDYANPHVCDALKERHDECFYQWYATKFLKGTAARGLRGRQPCERQFDEYSACVRKKMDALGLSWVAQRGINEHYLEGTSGPDYELMKKMKE